MNRYDLIVFGAGPSGIFLCFELKRFSPSTKILLIDQGRDIKSRICPVASGGKCIKCKPFCHITNGFSGAGAFSDGKLSLYDHDDDDIRVGGEVHKYIGVEYTKELIDYTDRIYLDFGADSKVEGVSEIETIRAYQERARKYGVNLISIPIRHLGTEKAHELYFAMQQELKRLGVDIYMQTVVDEIIVEDGVVKGVVTHSSIKQSDTEVYYAPKVVLAVGRKGAKWLSNMCEKHSIKNKAGVVDIGIRYELPDRVMADVNKAMYEAKFVARLKPYEDKVRTFCQNPSGFVSSEVYDNGLTLVNGHSYK